MDTSDDGVKSSMNSNPPLIPLDTKGLDTSEFRQPFEPSTSIPALKPHEPSATQRLRDASLHFFANASNETLGACAVGLCASTYLVLGRVGLVLIGAVGGIVLHANWEHSQHAGQDITARAEATKRRKEQGLELAKRALEWRDRSRLSTVDDPVTDKLEPSIITKQLDYSDFQPETKEALTNFTDAVIRDYVKYWYNPILPADLSFPSACRQILTGFILSFSKHLSRKRTADPFLDFIANSTSILIVFLIELGTALKASPNQEVDAAIKTYLEYEPDSSLANVLNHQQQEKKLGLVADDILQTFLDSKTYNCLPAQAFLRQLLAGLILQSTITSCSKPEWINGWIVYMLEDGEPEIMNAIDAGVENISGAITNTITQETKAVESHRHQRRVSRAEEAMQEAMREAQRINEMIAEDEARRKRREAIHETESTTSAATTDAGIPTPTSSDSDLNRRSISVDPHGDMIFDAEGNAIPSGTSSPARLLSPISQKPPTFTNFDQLTPSLISTPVQPESSPPPPTEAMSAIPLTLHNAHITLLDMGTGNDKVALKQKPNDEFLVQIEPASSRFPGWMVTRKYSDFEPLHENLRRIAVVSGVPEFNEQFPSVPAWKNQTRYSLIVQLESYLKQTLKHERLAESESMKKFLGKDIGLDKAPAANKNVLSQGAAALDNVGKGFINVLGQGGKGIAGGGKAVLGGVQGVFGAVGSAVGGPKKTPSASRTSVNDLSRVATTSTLTLNSVRPSSDYMRSSSETNDQGSPSLGQKPFDSPIERIVTTPTSATEPSEEIMNLPPTPSEMLGDFEPSATSYVSPRKITQPVTSTSSHPSTRPATPTQPATQPPTPALESSPFKSQGAVTSASPALPTETAPVPASRPANARKDIPLSEEETRITVDLMFAIITSTYSLSSAWTFRLSLLSAAKTFLLRPNNPQLESIRTLLQESLITNNTSDAAIAAHIVKLRENSLPTEEELAKWPKEPSTEEKEKLRVRARKLLVERGMPQALTSVMGQAASGEALGKVFDCLQIQEVSRGLIFAMMLQAIRAILS